MQRAFEGFELPVDNKAKLQEQFIVPPFSILDTRQGYWQDRKRQWINLGIKSEVGRGDNLLYNSEEINGYGMDFYRVKKKSAACLPKGFDEEKYGKKQKQGTSIFDPLLCELMYKWFVPKNGTILDPFSGGSVRGIVASVLGYSYTGIELSAEQVAANKEQASSIVPENMPVWHQGDCNSWLDNYDNKHYDFVFSCPPYHDLEEYSDDMNDLSNMSWDTFKYVYNQIIGKLVLRLKEDRFACFVVSEIRGDDGTYKSFVPYTINCFNNAGAKYYNEIILVNSVGTLPVRIASQFAYRKIGRTHQNILVFYKGNYNNIPKYFNKIDTGNIAF